MREKPIISIIIPVHNAGSKILKCLNSLEKQTIKEDIEVLIVDDASTDDSVELIQKKINDYSGRIKYRLISNSENGRAGKARNEGIKKAEGEYVVFVDQDDYLDKRMLEVLFGLIEGGKYDCSACDIGEIEGKTYHRNQGKNKNELSYEDRLFLMKGFGYVFAIMIKKQILITNNMFFPEKLMFEDVLYNLGVISCIESINTTDEVLYLREGDIHSQTASLSIKKLRDRVNSTLFYLNNYEKSEKIQPYMPVIKQFAFYYIFVSCIWFMMNDYKLFDFSLFKICFKEGRKLDINWEDIFVSQKQLPIEELKKIRQIYNCPIKFFFYYFSNIFKRLLSKIHKSIPGGKQK